MKYTNKTGKVVENHYGAQFGYTDVGEPVQGRYDAMRAAQESLKDLWSDESFQSAVKRRLHRPKARPSSPKVRMGMRMAQPQILDGISPLPEDPPVAE